MRTAGSRPWLPPAAPRRKHGWRSSFFFRTGMKACHRCAGDDCRQVEWFDVESMNERQRKKDRCVGACDAVLRPDDKALEVFILTFADAVRTRIWMTDRRIGCPPGECFLRSDSTSGTTAIPFSFRDWYMRGQFIFFVQSCVAPAGLSTRKLLFKHC